ncbi:phage tail spike protein [Fervidibacillus albus]|uniref:Phage tail protein n=1 Tax=Fervidibacillus albus TaxID=2980026 RepID=A0A9E8RY76_9BACI|nr:phage tail spike protein [Fervidibacillus albus]WAA10337.1 phage tail protein [Fervidibacillus albus]
MDSTALLYFDKNLEFQFYLSNELPETCPYYDAPHKEALDFTNEFEVRVPANHKNTESIAEGGYIGFIDREGDFQLFKIGLIEEEDSLERGLVRALFCKYVFEELGELPVEDKRPQNCTATEAIDRALDLQNKWKRGNVAELGLNSVNFYYQSIKEALLDIQNTWGGEIKPRIEIDENNRVTGFYIDLLNRRGSDTGMRIEIERNAKYIKRKYDEEGIKTAIYPRGKGQESGDGYTRRLTIADVEWSKENGDPVDKPLSQEWIGDPEALQKYGIDDGNGNKIHRFGFVNFDEDEDPAILIQKGWETLQELKNPKVQYEASAEALALEGEKIQLGDTVAVVDYNFVPAIVVKSRIIELTHYKDTGEINIKLGNFMPAFSMQNEEIQKKIDDLGGKTGVIDYIETGPISDDDFEDVIPGVPQNVTATGLFKTISIHWDFDPTYNIAAYEVHGSRSANFYPDTTTLLFRGKTGGFVHDVGEPNQKWYYKVRAINPHGTASQYSQEVSAETIQINAETDVQPFTITNELIAENASIDFAKISNVKITNAMIDNIDASKIKTGTLEASRVRIGSTTVFEDGYDPTTKATIEDVQSAKDYADNAIISAKTALEEYAENQKELAIQISNAYADGIVTEEEQARIQDVEEKLQAAKEYADQKKSEAISSVSEYINQVKDNIDGQISIINTQLSTHEDRITSKVSRTEFENNIDGIENSIDELTIRIAEAEAEISVQTDLISAKLSRDEFETKLDEQLIETENTLINYVQTEIQATLENVNITFENIQSVVSEHGEELNAVKSFFEFSEEGLEIGKSNSPFSINISNEQMDFKENNQVIAYVNGQKLYITDVEVLSSLTVGNHKIQKYNDEITLVMYVGE